MTSETTYSEKGRAVVLAALMVLSVVAMTVSFTGAAAAQTASNADQTFTGQELDDEPDAFLGQTIHVDEISNGNAFDGSVQIREGFPGDDGDVVDTVRLDSNGEITFDLDEGTYSEGTYYLRDTDNGDEGGPIWVSEHSVDFEFTDGTIGSSENPELSFSDQDIGQAQDGARGASEVNVTIEQDGELLDQSAVDTIFTGSDADLSNVGTVSVAEGDDGEGIATITDFNVDDSATLDFSNLGEGDYVANVDVTDTTASTTANLTVADGASDATFDQNTYEQDIGDNAEFTLEPTETNQMYVNLSDSSGYYDATLRIDNYDDADEVNVTFNTFRANCFVGSLDETRFRRFH